MLLFLIIVVPLWVIWVLVAISTLRSGWRGRRVGKALVCAACGYDLAGIIGVKERCAECGQDLRPRGAVAVGVRKRSIRRVIGGSIGLVLGVSVLAAGWSTIYDVGSQALMMVKPIGWLIKDLKSSGPGSPVPIAAAEALARRWRTFGLSPAHARGVVDASATWLRSGGRCSLTDYMQEILGKLPDGDPRARDLFEAIAKTMEADPTGPYSTWDGMLSGMWFDHDLSPADHARLAEVVIARQAALGGAVNTPLAHRFQRDASRGLLGADLLQRYMEASIDPVLLLDRDPPLLADDTVRITVDLQTKETVMGTRLTGVMRLKGDSAAWPVAGPHIAPAVPEHQTIDEWSSNFHGSPSQSLRAWVTAPSEPGEYTLEVEVEFSAYELEERGSGYPVCTSYADPGRLGDLDQPKIRFAKTCKKKIVVRPSAEEPIAFGPTEIRREDIVKFSGRWGWPDLWASTTPGPVVVSVCLDPPPITMAADVYLRDEGGDHRVGWLLVPCGEFFGSRVSALIPDLRGSKGQIVLRPAPGILRRPSSLGPIYDQELVLDPSFYWRPNPKEWDDGGYYNWPERR